MNRKIGPEHEALTGGVKAAGFWALSSGRTAVLVWVGRIMSGVSISIAARRVCLMRAVFLIASVLVVTHAYGQSFELLLPSGEVTATIQMTRGRMTVNERSGGQVIFLREPRYDDADGQFAGFVNVDLHRVVRFPRSGDGPLQIADLEDRSPRFQWTRRLVRPIAAGLPNPPPAYPPGSLPPGPGAGYPGFTNPGAPFIDPTGYGWPRQVGYQYPQSILIDSKLVPDPPLEPVQIDLLNSGRTDLQVTVVDRRDPTAGAPMRIRSGATARVTVQRDSGGRLIERYRTINEWGESTTRDSVRDVPPQIRYEIVVHQWEMQSIAIDRTGKSPNQIEDVNYRGRGLGRFVLPAGDQLQSGTIDVYRGAIESGLDWTVPPILAAEKGRPVGPPPLQRAILEAQQRAQSRN